MKAEFFKLKPYFLISWVGWISDKGSPLRIEPGEERFIKVTFADPDLSWRVSSFPASQTYCVGYDGEKMKKPKYINHYPALQWFFSYTTIDNVRRLHDVKDEVKTGLIIIEARFGTKSEIIDRNKILGVKQITKAAWDSLPPRKLYFDL